MSPRYDTPDIEQLLRDATHAYVDTIEPAPDSWAQLRGRADDLDTRQGALPRAVLPVKRLAPCSGSPRQNGSRPRGVRPRRRAGPRCPSLPCDLTGPCIAGIRIGREPADGLPRLSRLRVG